MYIIAPKKYIDCVYCNYNHLIKTINNSTSSTKHRSIQMDQPIKEKRYFSYTFISEIFNINRQIYLHQTQQNCLPIL